MSDRIARAFNRSGATRAVALDISKAFNRVWHAGLLHKLKSYGISGQIFGLISSFLSNRRLQVVLDEKSSQEYPVNAGVPHGSILGPTLFLLYINDLPDDFICNIAIYADDTTLYSKCDQASDPWQQLNIPTYLPTYLPDPRDTMDWGRKWLVGHVRNTAVMSGLVLLVATCNCWMSYRNAYVGLLVLHLLPLLNPWLIVEMLAS